MSQQTANMIDDSLSMAATMSGAAATRSAQATTFSKFKLPPVSGCAPVIKEGMVFPKNPKDLLPNTFRDQKGYIYANDRMRIKPEKHLVNKGEIYNPRHHGSALSSGCSP